MANLPLLTTLLLFCAIYYLLHFKFNSNNDLTGCNYCWLCKYLIGFYQHLCDNVMTFSPSWNSFHTLTQSHPLSLTHRLSLPIRVSFTRACNRVNNDQFIVFVVAWDNCDDREKNTTTCVKSCESMKFMSLSMRCWDVYNGILARNRFALK